jgi:hypothetical protein
MSPDHHSNKEIQRGTPVMKRSNEQFENAREARLAAGDNAYCYLVDNFTPKTAIAIAVSVEYRLAARWEIEQEQMRARREPYTVFEISIEGMARTRKAFDNVLPGQSDERAEKYVADLLAQFPADQAWWTAHRVREEIGAWYKRKATRLEAA